MRDPDGHRLRLFHAGEKRKHPPWRLPGLLAALEEARDALITAGHPAEAAQVEHQVQLLSRRLGFDESRGQDG
jgi:hypothetical protein